MSRHDRVNAPLTGPRGFTGRTIDSQVAGPLIWMTHLGPRSNSLWLKGLTRHSNLHWRHGGCSGRSQRRNPKKKSRSHPRLLWLLQTNAGEKPAQLENRLGHVQLNYQDPRVRVQHRGCFLTPSRFFVKIHASSPRLPGLITWRSGGVFVETSSADLVGPGMRNGSWVAFRRRQAPSSTSRRSRAPGP